MSEACERGITKEIQPFKRQCPVGVRHSLTGSQYVH